MSFQSAGEVWTGTGNEARGGLHVNDDIFRAFAKSDNQISSLRLQGSPVTDEGLANLGDLSPLEELFLIEMGISDCGLVNVFSQQSLRSLGLNGCKRVTSKSFPVIGKLAKLEMLVLSDTSVDDTASEHLSRLVNLKALSLGHTCVSSECLRHISTLRNLERLRLCGTEVDDSWLEQLGTLPKLRRLCLNGTKVTSRGIYSLIELPGLQSLELQDTAVDDDAVEAFCEMQNLQLLSLAKSKVSAEGCLSIKERQGCAVGYA